MYANVLRAGTLNDPRVVRLVSANFVPTHFNNNDPSRAKDDAGFKLWTAIRSQKALQGQGIWVVAPGRACARRHERRGGRPPVGPGRQRAGGAFAAIRDLPTPCWSCSTGRCGSSAR